MPLRARRLPFRRAPSRRAVLRAVLLTAPAVPPAAAVDAPDAPGPWKVGHRDLFVISPPPDHLPASTPQFYDPWYPVDAPDWVGAFTAYEVFTIPPSTSFEVVSDAAREDADVSSTGGRALVVFSHGSGGVAYQSIELVEALASHGFVVIAPTHVGNNFFDNGGDLAAIARQRPKDVSASIDYMLARNADAGDDFFGATDADRIGVTGHSFGGFTALAMASGYDDGVEDIPPDSRVKAVFPVSPAHGLLEDAELQGIDRAVCYMDGSIESADTKATRPFGLTTGAAFNCWAEVAGAAQGAFANICDIGQALKDGNLCPTGTAPCGPDPTDPADYTNWNLLGGLQLSENCVDVCVLPQIPIGDVNRLQNLYTVAFFRRFLNQELDYMTFLWEDYGATEPDVTFLAMRQSSPSVPALAAAGALVLCGALALTGLRRLGGA